MLKEYDDVFQGLGKVTDFEHKITIDPEVKPVSQQLRRMPVYQIEAVNNKLDRMLEQDIIEEVTEASPWVSNLVIVPKKSGDIRVCCDLREVNKAVIRERYVLPKIDDTLHAMRDSKFLQSSMPRADSFSLRWLKSRVTLPRLLLLVVVIGSSELPSVSVMRAKLFKR